MTKLLKSLIILTFIANLSYSQSLQGNVNCVGAIVEYTYVARAMESPEDTAYGGSHMVTASWPSSAAAAAGRAASAPVALRGGIMRADREGGHMWWHMGRT